MEYKINSVSAKVDKKENIVLIIHFTPDEHDYDWILEHKVGKKSMLEEALLSGNITITKQEIQSIIGAEMARVARKRKIEATCVKI
jgi:hypothetical protein